MQFVNKDTVLAWWLRLGERAPVLWQKIAQGQVRGGTVQLDELHTLIKKRASHLTEREAQLGEVEVQWVWTAMDPVHKLLLVAQVGPRRPSPDAGDPSRVGGRASASTRLS